MPNLVKSQLIPLTIPSAGMSTRFPVVEMPNQFSPWIRDFDNEGGFYESRRGVKRMFNAADNYVSAIAPHPTNKNRVVYLDTYASSNALRYYDAVSGSSGSISALAGTASTPRAITTNFNKNAYFFRNGAEPFRYDGTTFANTGYTGPTMANIVFGFSYKSRMYLVPAMSTSTWYGTIGGVTGATKEVDWASLTQDAGIIMCGFSFTLSSGLDSQSLFALVFDTGEMLVYSGNYPDDVLTWNLVARARISAPVGYQSIIEQNGDVLVITKNGITSCRELLTTAQGNVQAASITTEIEKYWTQLIGDIQNFETLTSWSPSSSLISYINGSYHQVRNKIAIFVPKYLSSDRANGYVYEDAAAVLVYDIATKSWVVHVPRIISSASQFISSYYWPAFGKLLFGTNDVTSEGAWEYWGASDGRDEIGGGVYAEYFPQIYTAYTKTTYQSLLKGVFVTHQGALFSKGQAAVQFLGDSGSIQTTAQSVPASTANVSRDFYNIGLTAENFSVILGTSTDVLGTVTTPYRVLDITAQIEVTRSPT